MNYGCISPLYSLILSSDDKQQKEPNLVSPYWVTGFSDAEASFSVSIFKAKDRKTAWRIIPNFIILLHERDKILLEKINEFFKSKSNVEQLGSISIDKNGMVNYSVRSVKNLTNVIIPHFVKYPLLTKKQSDFLLFKSIVDLINKNEHLTDEGIIKIVSIKDLMNRGLSSEL